MMNYPSHPGAKLELGRRIWLCLGMCGNDSKEGLVVAIHGEPGAHPDRRVGVMTVMDPRGCTFDVITFDGVLHRQVRESSIDHQAIGGVRLLEKVHGPRMIERAHRLVAERSAEEARQKAEAPHRMAEAQAQVKLPDQVPHFVWNGIKDAKGAPLQKAWYTVYEGGSVTGRYPPGTVAIHARDYARFSDLVRACFQVRNDTDLMSDYFDSDSVYVAPTHPLYAQVRAGFEAQEAYRQRRQNKRSAR